VNSIASHTMALSNIAVSSALAVAPKVVPVKVTAAAPLTMVVAVTAEQSSFTGGVGGVQEVHCNVVTRHADAVPQPGPVCMCRRTVATVTSVTTRGVTPLAKTLFEVSVRVKKSVATLLVN